MLFRARILILFLFFVSGYAFPVLNPSDPEYTWMDALIEKEFSDKKPFSKADFQQTLEIYKKTPFYQALTVRNNEVIGSSQPNGDFKELLIYLCKSYGLPDLELIVYVHDGLRTAPSGDVPLFTRCRKMGMKNTLLFWYAYAMPWVEDQYNRVEVKCESTSWDKLINKAHWRGNTTDCTRDYGGGYTLANWHLHPRGKACWLSLQYPTLLDAAFVLFPRFGINSSDYDALANHLPTSPRVSIEECLNYKYQLLIAGVAAPWSSDWKIQAGRVIFRQSMPWEVYWDPLFKPWEHYIPVKADCSDLIEKIVWARLHEEDCKNLATRSRIFMQTHAKPEHMALYCYKVLVKYATLLTYRP